MLSGLGRLTALTLRVHSLWGRSSPVEAICSLTRLAKLQISSTEPLPAALGPRLTALCQLEELQLSETCIHNEWLALAMPAPHDLPRLRAFSMTAEHLQASGWGRPVVLAPCTLRSSSPTLVPASWHPASPSPAAAGRWQAHGVHHAARGGGGRPLPHQQLPLPV